MLAWDTNIKVGSISNIIRFLKKREGELLIHMPSLDFFIGILLGSAVQIKIR
jgi:hypothetical protein